MANLGGISLPSVVQAVPDPLLLRDPRILWNLLAQERLERAQSASCYCHQPEITLPMIKLLATWLMKVCEEEHCEEGIFPLAMSYIRICLSLFPVEKNKLQLLGSVCLLIASKIRGSGLTIEMLSFYTANSVPHHLIKEWEVLIVGYLRWNLVVIIAHDFLDHILERIEIPIKVRTVLRKHSHKFITVCSVDYTLSALAPSLISGACVILAMFSTGVLYRPEEEMIVDMASIIEASPAELQNAQFMIVSAFSEDWLHPFLQ